MHSGKTTLATMLEERYNYHRHSLADGVKNAACWMLTEFLEAYNDYFPDRWDGLQGKEIILPINRWEMEEAKAVFRPFLQWLGTDFARNYCCNQEVWIDIYRTDYETYTLDPYANPVVCDDVRFPNEATALKEMGFTLIRLNRPEKDRHASIRTKGGDLERTLTHPSETEHQSIECDETHSVRSLDDLAAIAADIGTRWCVAS
jgi:hypothetical protein